MKRLVAALVAACLMIAVDASAQQPRRHFGPGGPSGMGEGSDMQRPPGREAVWPGRDHADGAGGPGGPHGPGRMSPEERQQLRRDINAHGRDIYRQERERR